MKNQLFLFLLLVLNGVSHSQPIQDTLTNSKIVAMVKSGVSDLLIKKSITSSKTWRFDLSSESIISLKRNKVSDTIIVAMFDKDNIALQTPGPDPINANKQPSNTTVDINRSITDLKPGIYYESHTKNSVEYIRLNNIKPSSGFRTDPIVGIAMKRELSFLGKSALMKIKSASPIFYLVVGAGYENIIYQPSQFVVVFAELKKGNRIVSGKTGIGAGAARTYFQFDSKDIVTPTFTRINENLYKVSFEKKLPIGNYFFGPTTSEANSSFLEFDIIK